MSRTLHEAIARVRYHIRDWRVQDQAFIDPEVIVQIQSDVRFLAPQLLLGEQWTTGIVTLVPGTDTYALPGTQQYANLRKLRKQSDGLEVPIVDLETFERIREGFVLVDGGEVLIAMLIESAAQAISVRFWPVPGEADVLDGFRSLLPAGFYTAGTLALAALPASTTIPFDDQAFEALCYTTASNLYAKMTDEKRASNGLASDAASNWPGMASSLIRESRARRLRQQSSTHVRRARRW